MSILTKIPAGVRPAVWGFLAGVSGLCLLALLVVLQTALSYDRDCGGLLPFMGKNTECTLLEYLRVRLPLNFEIVYYSYRYFLAAILFTPVVILETYYLYLRRRAGGRKGRAG